MAPRVRTLDAEADLAAIERLGGGFLIPDDPQWPAGLNDLEAPPLGLWYRGNITHGVHTPVQCAAVIGSRDSTAYGASVAGEMAHGVAQRGICVAELLA